MKVEATDLVTKNTYYSPYWQTKFAVYYYRIPFQRLIYKGRQNYNHEVLKAIAISIRAINQDGLLIDHISTAWVDIGDPSDLVVSVHCRLLPKGDNTD